MCCTWQHKRYKEVYIEFPKYIWKWNSQKSPYQNFAGMITMTRGKNLAW